MGEEQPKVFVKPEPRSVPIIRAFFNGSEVIMKWFEWANQSQIPADLHTLGGFSFDFLSALINSFVFRPWAGDNQSSIAGIEGDFGKTSLMPLVSIGVLVYSRETNLAGGGPPVLSAETITCG